MSTDDEASSATVEPPPAAVVPVASAKPRKRYELSWPSVLAVVAGVLLILGIRMARKR